MTYSPAEQARLIAEANRRFGAMRAFASLEDLLTSEHGFGLTTATALQRAICRIADGKPLAELATHPHVVAAVGDVRAIDGKRPREIDLLAGIRTFKSLFAAVLAVWATRTVDVSRLGHGEMPRFSILSITKDLAHVIFRHLVGNIMARPGLRSLLLEEPTADTAILRTVSGVPMEVRVVAGARAGASVVARWSAGIVYDEATRMLGQDEGVVNLDDTHAAVVGRLLPGAQSCKIGSPWAPFGPMYDEQVKHWKKPSVDLVVIRARADWLNPVWWTPERAEELRRTDPVAYQTDFLAEFADAEEAMYPLVMLEACTRAEPLIVPREPGHEYVAAMDPATRGNAWTLVIATRTGRKKRIVFAKQWQGSKLQPLKPREVLFEIATALRRYGLSWCYTDQWSADPLRDLAQSVCDENGAAAPLDLVIEEWTQHNKTAAHMALQAEMAEGFVELPPDSLLAKDFKVVKKRVTQSGVAIDMPQTSDGRHADYAAAVAKCLHRWIEEDKDLTLVKGTSEYWRERERQQIAAEIEQLEQQQGKEWWQHQ